MADLTNTFNILSCTDNDGFVTVGKNNKKKHKKKKTKKSNIVINKEESLNVINLSNSKITDKHESNIVVNKELSTNESQKDRSGGNNDSVKVQEICIKPIEESVFIKEQSELIKKTEDFERYDKKSDDNNGFHERTNSHDHFKTYQKFKEPRDFKMVDFKNRKKILCNNVLYNGVCNYNQKCMYAHSLEEQVKESIRTTVYNLLDSSTSLANLDLVQDVELYRTLVQLTKLCDRCEQHRCPGGYNCKNGALDLKHVICYNDLVTGTCDKHNCRYVHLTDRGLIPYKIRESVYRSYTNEEKDEHIINLKKITPPCVLINDDFIKSIGVEKKDLVINDSDIELDLNDSESSCECNISIFTKVQDE